MEGKKNERIVCRWIFIFGACGALLRYSASLWFGNWAFPVSTLLVNCVGCFLMQLLFTWGKQRFPISEPVLTGIGTGLIGALTTFSTFSCDSAALLLNGEYGIFLVNVLLSMGGGLAAAALGYYCGRGLCRREKRS